ncbi:MAG: DUF4160 domain-containing protein [Planctomycetaceae bacterium]|nr:DUF4160 domain-containing protein [Planctomycetaceae bacterium]
MHVRGPDGECKFWLEPVQLAGNRGIAPSQVRDIERLVFQNAAFLIEKYDEYHHR